ncbi:hypothetical protein [Streptomyces sp. NPDC058092]|uniref:hypothetical protein n=1 Tax=Streptomyces sp. NPDC058092 TaxID=3346336 RepID=UPI0036E26D4B
MHFSAPLPAVDLADAQWRLIAQLVTASLRYPGNTTDDAEVAAARGIDPEQIHSDVSFLTWLKLIERRDDRLVATALGAAVHYRRLHESSELRLSEVVRFAEAHEAQAPQFTRAVQQLAQGSISFEEAMSGAARRSA